MIRLDPISLEIISNALRSITDETYVALMKSAYSTNIKERHDHSTAIMDRSGRLVVQAVEGDRAAAGVAMAAVVGSGWILSLRQTSC